jgi:Tol biopolymer transport system component
MAQPVWMPDGGLSYITYAGPGDMKMYAADPSLTSVELLLGGTEPIGNVGGLQFTADGQHVLFTHRPRSGEDRGVYVMALDGAMKTVPFIIEEPLVTLISLSPDSRWIAGTSGTSVIVQPFDLDSDQSAQRQVIANARQAFWSADSSELFFMHPETDDVMGVRITADPELTISAPRKLVDSHAMQALKEFDRVGVNVHPDGRFVYIAEPAGGPDPHLQIVQHFDDKVNRLFDFDD